jgi:hypothetical protein
MSEEPKNDYLWDGGGEPDPEVRKLETMLSRLRHNQPAPEFPAYVASPRRSGWLQFFAPQPLRWAAAAATLIVAATGAWLLRPKPAVVEPGWDVSRIEGAPRVAAQTIRAAAKLAVGQVLETDDTSKAGITSQDLGEIVVGPGTRLRLLDNRSGTKRLILERGTISATIWAPPGEFVVDTPSATAVDLGCVYSLSVDASGNAQLHTTLGWVGFKFGDRESFIPAGAVSFTGKNTGPGTPYFEDAAHDFRAAVDLLDRQGSGDDARTAAFSTVIKSARPRDAFTLWHLLSRVPPAERSRLFDRLAELVPAPQGVTREGILRLDQPMLDLWWNEFGLGDISLWRHWEHTWSARTTKRM